MAEEETREKIEDIINNNEEPVKEEPSNEEIKEEEIKPKAKPKAKSRAKPKQIKITKESIEPVEPIVEEAPQPIVEEPPTKVYKLKQIVQCPDCKMDMTVHTLNTFINDEDFVKLM